MIRLFPTGKTKNQISLKKFLLAFFVCVSVFTWIGISTIFADEDDPGDNMENTEPSFQNAAQEQHAKNVAIKSALQDPAVIAAIAEAKESGNFEDARALFKETVADITQQISDMRAEGKGLGVIAKDLGVHPKYIGLGHFKNKAKYDAQTKLGSQKYNGHNKDRGLALGHSKDKSGGHGVGHGRGNGRGNGGGNGGGHGGGKK